MSRVGRRPVVIPDEVEVALKDRVLQFKGPVGTVRVSCSVRTKVSVSDGMIWVKPKSEKDSPYQGLMHALIRNAVEGVSKGFERKLEIVGVGYRAELQNNALRLFVGLSHPVVIPPTETVQFTVDPPGNVGGLPVTVVTVKGTDKELVGRVAAQIRAKRPREPYKGKGIKYGDEVVRRKAGKAAVTAK